MKYLLTIISALFFFSIKAQTANIKSVEQKGQKIYITYDLKGNPGKYNIKLFVKSKNSYSWSSALKSVSGNVGANQTVGINKQIVWDVLKDRDQFQGDWMFGIEAVNKTLEHKIKKKREKEIRVNSSNEHLLLYTIDLSTPLNITFCKSNANAFTTLGYYFGIRTKPSLRFPSTNSYRTNNDGNLIYRETNAIYKSNPTINNIYNGKTYFLFGFTKMISFPIWLYSGMGLGWERQIEDVSYSTGYSTNMGLNNITHHDDLVYNKDRSNIIVNVETGFQFKIKKIVVSTGVFYDGNFKTLISLGIAYK